MAPFSSAVKFDVEKFDGKMVFGLWQVQVKDVLVKDVLIQSGLHKMRKVWEYCPGGASSAKGSEVRNAMEEDELLAGPQLPMGIGWRLMQEFFSCKSVEGIVIGSVWSVWCRSRKYWGFSRRHPPLTVATLTTHRRHRSQPLTAIPRPLVFHPSVRRSPSLSIISPKPSFVAVETLARSSLLSLPSHLRSSSPEVHLLSCILIFLSLVIAVHVPLRRVPSVAAPLHCLRLKQSVEHCRSRLKFREREVMNNYEFETDPKVLNMLGTTTRQKHFIFDQLDDDSGLASYVAGQINRTLSWKDVKWLQTITKLPILAKGALTAEN
ncbi:hypothetical protein PIB30_098789, partial [Stylosanthes scabra]|nr:hypothetical protein [Stylosanthes scabra]